MESESLAKSETVDRRQDSAATLLLIGLSVLALVLRFWRVGAWNFQATEIFTLRDSMTPAFDNPRPLGYLLNYYLVRPFHPLDEFGLRLFPTIFGILAVPAFYWVARRLVGTRAALFGTLLLTVSPLLILYSQLARYWSLVFLFSTIYPYYLYLGIRDHDRRALIIGIGCGILAALAHPVSVLLVAGLGLWLVLSHIRPGRLQRLWGQRRFRWGVGIVVVILVVIALRFVPLLEGWITQHDQNPGSGQFLLRPPATKGLKQIFFLLAFVDSLTVPLVLTALAGIYVIWRERERSLATMLICVAGVPIAFLTLITLRTASSQYYLLPAVPVFFLGAGVFLERLTRLNSGLYPRWLVPATVTAIVIATGMPTLASDYRDGRRYDFRRAAAWLQPRFSPGDIVYSDQHMVLAYYLPGKEIQRLRQDTIPLSRTMRELESRPGKALWVIAPAPSHAFRTNLKFGGLLAWLFQNCEIRNTVGVGRVDFREQYLQIYRCSTELAHGNRPAPVSQ
ncbi:MAG: glycosyltransferase family 39 protein [Gemmatimonadales bacterium]